MKYLYQSTSIGCLLVFLLLLTSCGGGSGSPSVVLSNMVPVRLAIHMPVQAVAQANRASLMEKMLNLIVPDANALINLVGVTSVTITISGNGFTTIVDSFPAGAPGSTLVRNFNIPQGANRTFSVQGFNTPVNAPTPILAVSGATVQSLTPSAKPVLVNIVLTSKVDVIAPLVKVPAPITVPAVDATGTPKTNAAIVAFLATATATDNVDLNPVVTNNAPAQFPLGSTTVTFTSTDAAGNVSLPMSAIITVTDQSAPIIALLGSNPLNIGQGTTFIDPGSTVTDNVDIGLVATITGTVSTAVIGTYTRTYNTIDAASNAATAITRTVNVVPAGTTHVWTGTTNTTWNVANNWDVGTVPGAASHVFIPASPANQPVTAGMTIAALANQAGSTLNITGNSIVATGFTNNATIDFNTTPSTLTVTAGILLNVGTISSNVGAIIVGSVTNGGIILANQPMTIGGSGRTVDLTAGTVNIAAGVTLSLDIASSVSIDAVGSLWTGSGTVFFDISSTVTLTGNVLTPAGTGGTIFDFDTAIINGTGTLTNNGIMYSMNTTFTTLVNHGTLGGFGGSDVQGLFTSSPGSSIINGGLTLSGGVDMNGVTIDNAWISINTTGPVVFDNITFQNYAPTATPLMVDVSNTTQTYNNLNFNSPLTNGFHVDGIGTGNTITIASTNLVTGTTAPAFNAANTVVWPDKTSPVITLNGTSTMTVNLGSVFSDPGSMVSDNVDIGLVAAVTGVVDTTVAGQYTLTYNVADVAGNNAIAVTRTVNVVAAGQFIYSNDNVSASNTVSAYVINQSTGSLTPVLGSPFAMGGGARGGIGFYARKNIALTKSRNLLFVVNSGSNDVSVCSINPATGVLTLVVGSPFANQAGAAGMYSLTVNPTGTLLFVGNDRTRNISVFSVAGSGALTPVVGSPFLLSHSNGANTYTQGVSGMRINDSGTILYVTSGSVDIGAFSIAANGGLTPLASSPYSPSGAGGARSFDLNAAKNIAVSGGWRFIESFLVAVDGSLSPITQTSSGRAKFSLNNTGQAGSQQNVTMSPDGNRVVFSGGKKRLLSVMALDSAGQIAEVPGSSFTTTQNSSGYTAIHPNNQWVYATEVGTASNVIEFFSMAANGSLTSQQVIAAGAKGYHNDIVIYAPPYVMSVGSDTTPPVITLVGSVTNTIAQGGTFTDPGSVVTDNVDTGLSAVVTGTVNPALPGTYTLTYNVSDAATNNAMTITRTVTVNTSPQFTGAPAIFGAAAVGNRLTLINTGTSDADGNTVTLSYQWQANAVVIAGATASNYTVQAGDVGKTISCKLIADDGTGVGNATTTVTTSGLNASVASASVAGEVWQWGSQPTDDFNDIAFNGTLYVTVGDAGNIFTKSNGAGWVSQFTDTHADMNSVVWGNGQFVAVGENGTILTSVDGISWRNQAGMTQSLLKVIWSGTKYVAVGRAGAILTSSNAVFWSLQNSPSPSQLLNDIIWTGTQFVVVGSAGTVLTSPNGVKWTKQSFGGGIRDSFNGIAWDGGQLVAVNGFGGVFTSPGAVIWTQRTSGVSTILNDVVWNGTQFIAVGSSGTVLSSTNGVAWTVQTIPVTQSVHAVVWSGNQFMAVGGIDRWGITGVSQSSLIMNSSNGITWNSQINHLHPGTQRAIVWNGNRFVTGGDDYSSKYSLDGINWITHTKNNVCGGWIAGVGSIGLCSSIMGLIWDGVNFVSQGGGVYSSDGINWRTRSLGFSLTEIAWNGSSIYVAGGRGRTTNFSLDSAFSAPTVQTLPPAPAAVSYPAINSITWGANKFVAVGQGGEIFTSTGQAWSSAASNTTADIHDVNWNGAQFLAVGANGSVLSSPDGVTWTVQSSATLETLFAVTWVGAQYITVGSNGVLMTSLDGLTWTLRNSGTKRDLRDVVGDGMQLVVVGEIGTIIRSVPELDSDADGLIDKREGWYGTDPAIADSDGDGLNDGAEVLTYKTNPLVADTDGDGLSDGLEVNFYGTDPFKWDTDADGLSDGAEVNIYNTNPLNADSDANGVNDAMEVLFNTNPNLASSILTSQIIGQTDSIGVALSNALSNAGGQGDTSPYGLSSPYGMDIDVIMHRLFVADKGNNRILVFQLDVNNDIASRRAVNVIGQADFEHNALNRGIAASASSLDGPNSVSFYNDGTNQWLVVCDSANNRVLIYNITAGITNGMAASVVLGQSNMTTTGFALSATAMNDPRASKVMTFGNKTFLAVSEYVNDRTPLWDISVGGLGGLVNGQAANIVLGQPDFITNGVGTTAATQNGSNGLVQWRNYLLISDRFNHRVLAYNLGVNASNLLSGMSATVVLGQASMTTSVSGASATALSFPRQLAVHSSGANNYLFVADHANSRIVVYDLNALANGMAASFIYGQTTFIGSASSLLQNGFGATWGLAIAGNRLLVADDFDDEILSFDVSTLPAQAANSAYAPNAINNIGQTNWIPGMLAPVTSVWAASGSNDTGTTGLQSPRDAVVGMVGVTNYLFVADNSNYRVLAFAADANGVPLDMQADFVLGQPDFDHDDLATTATGMNAPHGVAFDDTPARKLLFVSDTNNNRVLVFDLTNGMSNGMAATNVLGQINFVSWTTGASTAPTATTLNNPRKMVVGAIGATRYLFVIDRLFDRVLMFDITNGITNAMAPAFVLGGPNFTTNLSGANINQLSNPFGVDFDPVAKRLFVADGNADRVMIWDLSGTITNGMPATWMLGQTVATSVASGLSQSQLNSAYDVTFDALKNVLWVADRNNKRVLGFDLRNGITTGMNASYVLGQPSIISATRFIGDNTRTAYTAYGPAGLTMGPNGKLIITYSSDNRIVIIGP